MEASRTSRAPEIPSHRHFSSLTNAVEELNLDEVAVWTPRQVAQWMYDAGFEPSIVEKFEDNDISGAILITLKFEDLRELDIPSFGQRTKVWNEIHVLRGSAPSTPKPPTPIDETASPCVESRPSRHRSRRERSSEDCASDESPKPHRKSSRRRHRKRTPEDVITPLESVSIVGIEQLMPKPHKCAKGENCTKWRRQQRLIENFKKEHPVSPNGGSVWIAGNPGNPLTAESMRETRPISDAVPSVVASSDVLGPSAVPAFRHLEEASLRNVQSRDPQENVKQFIKFQHMDPSLVAWSPEEPPTPPYEMFPTIPNPHAGLRTLPRLAIPPPRPAPPPRSASANAFSPYRMERVEAMSPDLRSATQSPSNVYRFGTPFSEMDVPVTAVPLGPVSRNASQSVPPNMSYRHAPAPPQRTQSRASARRPSFAMPRVDENVSTAPPTQTHFYAHQVQVPTQQPQHAAAAVSYPWSPVTGPSQRTADDVAHQGLMKKRKTKMLRHEWHEHHFTLKGTRLSMHKDARALDTLEYIDVDDYAIACSSLASGSKLNAAFKAMNISRGKTDKKDEAAFSFQLIPAAIEKGQKLRKRESSIDDGREGSAKAKTHYFAVKSRDERIDWMRELMLAKALKQKSEGFEVNMNGNMI
jgi:Ni/Co efflux regulator RcnB